MKTTSITVEIGATLNCGNFNNIRLNVSATVDTNEENGYPTITTIAKSLRDELLALVEDVDCDPTGVEAIAAIGGVKKPSVLEDAK